MQVHAQVQGISPLAGQQPAEPAAAAAAAAAGFAVAAGEGRAAAGAAGTGGRQHQADSRGRPDSGRVLQKAASEAADWLQAESTPTAVWQGATALKTQTRAEEQRVLSAVASQPLQRHCRARQCPAVRDRPLITCAYPQSHTAL